MREKIDRSEKRAVELGVGWVQRMRWITSLSHRKKEHAFQRFSRFLAGGETNPNLGRLCKPLQRVEAFPSVKGTQRAGHARVKSLELI